MTPAASGCNSEVHRAICLSLFLSLCVCCACANETSDCSQSRSSTIIASEAHRGLNKRRRDQNRLVKRKSINVIDPSTSIKCVSKYHILNGRLTLWKNAGVTSLGWRVILGQHKQDTLGGAPVVYFAVLLQLQIGTEFKSWLFLVEPCRGSSSSRTRVCLPRTCRMCSRDPRFWRETDGWRWMLHFSPYNYIHLCVHHCICVMSVFFLRSAVALKRHVLWKDQCDTLQNCGKLSLQKPIKRTALPLPCMEVSPHTHTERNSHTFPALMPLPP